MKRALLLLLLMALGAAADDYRHTIEAWHQRRLAALQAPGGWLSLAGLAWLHEGDNRVGSDPGCDVVMPKGPAFLGIYRLKDGRLSATLQGASLNGAPIPEWTLDPGAEEGSSVLTCGTLSWYPIQREGRWALRIKDTENPARVHFRGIERYPVNPGWRLEGRFEPHPSGEKISVPNVLGHDTEEECPGTLTFRRGGQSYSLEAVHEPGEQRFFVIFGDATNGHGSYGGGRFLYVDPPDASGKVVLDFNRAYNPPCCFTDFATCPRPPAANRLPLAVEAGEKAYAH